MNRNDEFVMVLESPDEGRIALAQALLDENGIRYYVKNHHLQSLYGMAQTGLYPYAIQVDPDDADRAREILSGIGHEGPEDELQLSTAPEAREPASSTATTLGLLGSRTARYIIVFLILVLPIILMIIGSLTKQR